MAGSDEFTVILNDGVSLNAKRAADAVDKLNEKLKDTGKAGPSGSLGLSSFGVALGELGARAVETAISIGIDLLESLAKTAEMASRFSMAFANVAGSVVAGNQEMARSMDLAASYGTKLEDTFRAIQQGQAAGFTEAQSRSVYQMGQDMQALGRSTEQVNHIFYALRQIQSVGFMNRREMMMLGNAGVPLKQLFARIGMGMGLKGNEAQIAEQVSKAISKRKITANDAISSVQEVIMMQTHETKIGDAGLKFANTTIPGLEGRITEQIEVGITKSAAKAEPALVRGLQSILKGIQTEDIAGGIPVITSLLEGIGDLMVKLGPKLPAIADNFVKAFGSASGFNSSSIDSLVDELPKIATAAGQFAGFLFKAMGYAERIATSVGGFFAKQQSADPLGVSRALGINTEKAEELPKQLWIGKLLFGEPLHGEPIQNTDHYDNRVDFDPVDHSQDNMSRAGGSKSPYGELRKTPQTYEAIASAAAESLITNQTNGKFAHYSIGDIHTVIKVEGSGSPSETAKHTYDTFHDHLGSHVERLLQGNGG